MRLEAEWGLAGWLAGRLVGLLAGWLAVFVLLFNVEPPKSKLVSLTYLPTNSSKQKIQPLFRCKRSLLVAKIIAGERQSKLGTS